MTKRINFDKEVGIGYIRVIKEIKSGMIEDTDELEVNPFISLDIDKDDRVVGLEIFGVEASSLQNITVTDNLYLKTNNIYSFRLNNKEVVTKYTHLGIDFCFSESDYKRFVGFDIIDSSKYPEHIL